MDQLSKKTGLTLTSSIFIILHSNLLQLLKKEYGIDTSTLLDYQLYGFNNYDESLPSIKKLIKEKTNKSVNGKYLYNKYREYKKGANHLKFNREFVFIYFQALGVKDVNEFIQQKTINNEHKTEQLKLLKKQGDVSKEDYYIGYYLGENEKIISTKFTISEEESKATWVLGYWETPNKQSLYTYKGNITQQENCLSFYFKNNDSEMNRPLFIGVYRDARVKVKQFLRGGYSGYSWDGNPVVGEVLFQRVKNKQEQNELFTNKVLNPIIAQYINKKRLSIPAMTPYNINELSLQSKFANSIEHFIKDYKGWLVSTENGISSLKLSILDNSGKSTLKITGHTLYKGFLNVMNSGNLLIGEFKNPNTLIPLYMSIDSSMVEKNKITGKLFGVENFKSFNAKIYLVTADDNLTEKINYKNSELTLKNSRYLPKFMLSDLKRIKKNNPIDDFFVNEFHHKLTQHIDYLSGTYKILFLDTDNKKAEATLKIKKSGKVNIICYNSQYYGNCMLSEGSVLSINITNRNGIPHSGQILNKINGNPNTPNFHKKGSWHFLDDDLIPNVRTIEII